MKKIIFLSILFLPFYLSAQKLHLSGYIYDKTSKETLIGAYISCDSLYSAVSNEYGFYELRIPKKPGTIRITYMGYETPIVNIKATKDTSINFSLSPTENKLSEVEVLAESAMRKLKRADGGSIKLSAKEIKNLSPQLLGESDLLKSLQTIPGVQGGREGTSDLFVRGGNSSENLILLDGVPVYHASHLLGMLSAFNVDAIKNVNFIRGGFPAQYGGRLSSVIDVRLKDGNANKFQKNIDIGILSSKFTLEGPVTKNSSFIISGRITPLNLLADITQRITSKDLNSYFFHDFTAKYNYRLGKRDKLYFSLYNSSDNFIVKTTQATWYQKFTLSWGTSLATTHWIHHFGKNVFSDLSFIYSYYTMQSEIEDKGTTSINNDDVELSGDEKYSSTMDDVGMMWNLNINPGNHYMIKTGVSSIAKTFLPNGIKNQFLTTSVNDTISGKNFYNQEKYKALSNDAYIENIFSPSGNWEFNAGVHFAQFLSDDTSYFSIEPRLSLSWNFIKHFAFKLNFAQMQQNIHLLGNSGMGVPTDIWVPSTKKIRPENNQQIDMGLYYATHNTDSWFNVYYKQYSNVIDFSQGTNFLVSGPETDFLAEADKSWENRILSGTGNAYGLEAYYAHHTDKWKLSAAYSLSWSWRKFKQLNKGKAFPFRYNRRHTIDLHFRYKLSENLSMNATWVYMSGFYATIPKTKYSVGVDGDNFLKNPIYKITIDASPKNNVKAPAYHRLDIGFSLRKEKKRGIGIWNLGVYNLYNRLNTFALYVDGMNMSSVSSLSLFPILPTISYTFKF